MSNETKRDVFNDALAYAPVGREYDPVNDDEAGDLRSCLSARYAAALPDDMPVIPEAVGCMITKMKPICNSILASQYRDYGKDHRWIIDHYDTFARAWLLGVWRVEETGEIVKLEAEK
ncbi:hypothetical protein FMM01_13525 [Schleiferilactobacillus harbinensis]|uniref:hypothetical protein n=1 Tax=Schleiferilactobacillus harbinensis TaxID=304207 RepID=UPI00123C6F90|nr:hypothetical protein [Schleiferilactobacillus harbinensis]QEU48246.1 hypothetical protein FMM01_13525 [Schleiferilactobacillus harbinensis]